MERAFENLGKAIFPGVGVYGIPQISPISSPLPTEWIAFNYAKTCHKPRGKGVHFFIDDYQFIRCWNKPDQYLPLLQKFEAICSPDFSLYTDMPMAMQIYNHYRKHWLAAYWQSIGISVIPTISWSTKESFEWCFDGEPTNSVVAISSVGTQNSKARKRLFLDGYEAMVEKLRPNTILFYGQVPTECRWNIVRVKAFQDKFEEVLCDGW